MVERRRGLPGASMSPLFAVRTMTGVALMPRAPSMVTMSVALSLTSAEPARKDCAHRVPKK